MLASIRLYGFILKIADNKGKFALKGHMGAIPFNGNEKMREVSKLRNAPCILPNKNPNISVMFLGSHEKWQKLCKTKVVDPNNGTQIGWVEELIRIHGKIFQVRYEILVEWIEYLQALRAYADDQNCVPLQYDDTEDTRQQVESFSTNIIHNALCSNSEGRSQG